MSRQEPKNSPRPSETRNDGNALAAGLQLMKSLDANRYATKKTIAQGLLDVALLTANASQLKYVLQVGQQHEFYTLMLSLIIVSIVLQVSAALLSIIMAMLKLHEDPKQNVVANILNHTALGLVTGALFCDVIKMNFGLDPAIAVVQVVFCVLLGSALDINKEQDQDNANRANNAVLIINLLIVIVNIILNGFELQRSEVDDSTNAPTTTTAASRLLGY